MEKHNIPIGNNDAQADAVDGISEADVLDLTNYINLVGNFGYACLLFRVVSLRGRSIP